MIAVGREGQGAMSGSEMMESIVTHSSNIHTHTHTHTSEALCVAHAVHMVDGRDPCTDAVDRRRVNTKGGGRRTGNWAVRAILEGDGSCHLSASESH